jgi:nitrite reductase (NADH) large subunit
MNISIIGNGICGIAAAKSISELSPKEKISVFTDEGYNYYPRPRLDQLLSEKMELAQIFPYNEEWFKKRNIEIFLGNRISAIDVSLKRLVSEGGAKHNYDKLLLAQGSSPFVPPIDGINSRGVFVYRNIDDVLKIRAYALGKNKAVVIGGGPFGLETARALSEFGLKVTVVESAPRLLPKQLDQEGAWILKSQIEKSGVEVILGATCDRVVSEGAKKYLLIRQIGRLEADLFVLSAGIKPNIEPAKAGGIIVNRGIAVDEHMRTNIEDIFAGGDCAEFNSVVYGIIPAAIEQGKAAASNMLGMPLEYKGTTFQVTLKVAGIDLTSVGTINPEGAGYEEVKKKDALKGTYRKVVVKDGKAAGAIIMGDKHGVAELTKIIDGKMGISGNIEALLADEAVLRETFLKQGG